MTEALQNFISILINYLDESRKVYNIPEVNYLSIPFLRQLDTNIYETQINISKSALLPYLTNLENEISGLFNFTDYRLIDLTVSPDKTVIYLKFASKPELPFELIWEIIKNMNYSQIVSLANSNRDYKTYFESTGWKDIFKIKYPDLYKKFNTDNKHYQQLFKLYNEMNYNQILDLINSNLEYKEYFEKDGWKDVFKARYPELYNKANLFREKEESNRYYEELVEIFDNAELPSYGPAYYIHRLEVVIYFIEILKFDPSTKNNQLIYAAISSGSLDTLKYLLSLPKEYNINLDDKSNNFYDAFLNAVRYEKLNMIQYLFEMGYNINEATIRTAYHVTGNQDIIDYLDDIRQQLTQFPS